MYEWEIELDDCPTPLKEKKILKIILFPFLKVEG